MRNCQVSSSVDTGSGRWSFLSFKAIDVVPTNLNTSKESVGRRYRDACIDP